MKIRDLDLDQYVIVYDMGKSENNNGMTVVGRVEEIVFNDDGENAATINSLGNLYDITDDNYFDLWTKSIEDKTEHIGSKKTSGRVFEGWAKDLYESRKNIEDNFDKLHQKIYENKSNDVQQKKRFEHLKGNLSRMDRLSSKEKLHWNAKGNIETEDGIEISIVETLLKGEDLQTYVTNEILRQRDNKKNSGVITSQSIETIGPNEGVVSHEDTVNHPSHYNYGDIEVIDYCDQVCKTYPPELAPYVFNAIKYLSRANMKNGREDIAKAKYFVERLFDKWE